MSLDVDLDHAREGFRLSARFSAAPGLTALFGRSGSGKTTLVDIVGGLIRPDRGKVAVDGQVLVDTESSLFVPKHRRRIGYVFQDSRLFPHLSVRRNLLYGRWFTRANGDGAAADLGAVVELLGIGTLLERRPDSLSGGEKQRVAIGRALLAHPRLLLMDEPLAGLASHEIEDMLEVIRALATRGTTVVIIEHTMRAMVRLAERFIVLDHGAILATGHPGEIVKDESVIEAYLGKKWAAIRARG
jgi:molybdate transport system ATP-binding protein